MKLLLATLLLLATPAYAGNFVYNDGGLPGTKFDLFPLPPGAHDYNYEVAADYNALTGALYDTRTAVTNLIGPSAGPFLGPVQAPDTGAATTLFVATSGNDANNCTNISTPCLTIQGAVNQLPKVIKHSYVISVAAGTYSKGAYISGFQFDVGQYTPVQGIGPLLKIVGTQAGYTPDAGASSGLIASATPGDIGPMFANNPGAGSPALSNWATITVSGAGWAAHNLKGARLLITAGPGVGQQVEINDNTSTVITITGTWPTGVTPTSASSFALKTATGSTIINGVLPIPPGATGYQGLDGGPIGGAAFSVANNTATGYLSGEYGSGATPRDVGIVDAPVSIEGFDFELPTFGSAVGAAGAQYVALRYSTIHGNGSGIRGVGGASLWFEGNLCEVYGWGCVVNGGYNIDSSVSGAALVFGNFATDISDGGAYSNGTYFVGTYGGTATVLQNHADSLNQGFTIGGAAQGYSVGNDWESINGDCISTNPSYGAGDQPLSQMIVDGDTFNNSLAALQTLGGHISLNDTPSVGTGNADGIIVAEGGRVWLGLNSDLDSISASTDIYADGYTSTKALYNYYGANLLTSMGSRVLTGVPAQNLPAWSPPGPINVFAFPACDGGSNTVGTSLFDNYYGQPLSCVAVADAGFAWNTAGTNVEVPVLIAQPNAPLVASTGYVGRVLGAANGMKVTRFDGFVQTACSGTCTGSIALQVFDGSHTCTASLPCSTGSTALINVPATGSCNFAPSAFVIIQTGAQTGTCSTLPTVTNMEAVGFPTGG